MVPFESLSMVSYSPSIVTMAISLAILEIFSVKEWCDLENQVRGRSRSLKMAPFNRPYATFYWSATVIIALSCTIFEFFDVDLEIGVRGHSRSLKLVPFKCLGMVSYSTSIVTVAVSVAVSEILGFVQGHWKSHHLIDRIRVPIRLP